jgi:hypothetical protein
MSLAGTPGRCCKTAACVLHIVFFLPKLPEWGSDPPASPWLRFKCHVSHRPAAACSTTIRQHWCTNDILMSSHASNNRPIKMAATHLTAEVSDEAEARCKRHRARASTMLSQEALIGTVTMYIWSIGCRLMPSHHVASWPEIWCGMRLKDTPRSGEAGESRYWAEVLHCCVMSRNVMHRALRWGLKFAAKFSAGVGVC